MIALSGNGSRRTPQRQQNSFLIANSTSRFAGPSSRWRRRGQREEKGDLRIYHCRIGRMRLRKSGAAADYYPPGILSILAA